MAEIIATQGWAMPDFFWDNFRKKLKDDITFQVNKRGYFWDEFKHEFSEGNHQKILLTHSFGLHNLKDEDILQADVLIIFSGFRSFIPLENTEYHAQIKYSLELMIRNFSRAPDQVLYSFWKKALPDSVPEMEKMNVNYALLKDDLIRLREEILQIDFKSDQTNVFCIQASEDIILGKSRTKELKSMFGSGQHYFEINTKRHDLPAHKTSKCVSLVSKHLPIFRTYEDEG